MVLMSEYVSPGHPDRLADGIADGIVRFAMEKDMDALVGVEVAVHRSTVFVDGRIAAGKLTPIVKQEDIKQIVQDVYKRAGYSHFWQPDPTSLNIITDLVIEPLTDDERAIRNISDDQNIVKGYALNCPQTNYLPPSHYVAKTLGEYLATKNKLFSNILGPDFKILVCLNNDDANLEWERLVYSRQHTAQIDNAELYSILRHNIEEALNKCFKYNDVLSSLAEIDSDRLYINGAGDFVVGGPFGDNGLSGKKLAVDFYGTEVSIGGGAIYGKDFHKADVVGAYKARQFALKMVKKLHIPCIETVLAWAPGEETPHSIEAWCIDDLGLKTPIDKVHFPPLDYFSLQCGFCELHAVHQSLSSTTLSRVIV